MTHSCDRRLFLTSLASTALAACSGGSVPIPTPRSPEQRLGTRVAPALTSIFRGGAQGVSIDSSRGDVYVAAGGNGIFRVESSGTTIAYSASHLAYCRAVAFDPNTRDLFAMDWHRAELWRFNQNGIGKPVLRTTARIWGLSFDPIERALYLTDVTNKTVIKMDSEYNTVTFASGFTNPQGVAVDPAAKMVYVTDFSEGRVIRIALDGTVKKSDPHFPGANGIARHKWGDLYVTDAKGLERMNPDGTATLKLKGAGFTGVAIDDATRVPYAAINGSVYKIG